MTVSEADASTIGRETAIVDIWTGTSMSAWKKAAAAGTHVATWIGVISTVGDLDWGGLDRSDLDRDRRGRYDHENLRGDRRRWDGTWGEMTEETTISTTATGETRWVENFLLS